MSIQKIFVVGAGLMGSGIAQNAITTGYTVTLNDQNMAALERAKAGIEKALGEGSCHVMNIRKEGGILVEEL